MSDTGDYRTDDLALATLLDISGFEYRIMALTKSKAIWIFNPPLEREEDFDQVVDDYNGFQSQVEPRQFILRYAEIRRELFALLPQAHRRSGVAVSDQA